MYMDIHSLALLHAVLYAYEQCLLCFGHCADIWYEAALYLQRASEAAVSIMLMHLYGGEGVYFHNIFQGVPF